MVVNKMTKVNFISRHDAKILLQVGFPTNTALISISDTMEERQEIFDLVKSKGVPAFVCVAKDMDSADSGFTVDLAGHMQDFIAVSIQVKENIIVHCLAGVSRSGAIAKWINDYYNLDDWYLSDYKGHNKYIYEVMNEAAGVSLAARYRELEKANEQGI